MKLLILRRHCVLALFSMPRRSAQIGYLLNFNHKNIKKHGIMRRKKNLES